MQTSLSLHFWEMQGDFDKMQGGHNRTRLEADVSQEVGCDSPYARSREVNLR